MNVLVADDSGVMRKIIVRAVLSYGDVQVTEAASGTEALDCFQKQAFDLVLSDWNMPGMTGLEFLQAVRAAGSQTPFILITTEAEGARVMSAIQAGVSDYLVKPFDKDVLCGKINKYMTAVTA